MKLTYLDRPTGATEGRCAVVLHREGTTPSDEAARVADHLPTCGRVVLPFGDYAFYPSGMEVGGACWYRVLPGYEGTDPISLAKAVVQVGDLVDDLDLDRPVLVGSGQGGVVALGAALLGSPRRPSAVCIDVPSAHVALLPASLLCASPARVLLLDGHPDAAQEPNRSVPLLTAHGIDVSTWAWSGGGTAEERDQAMTERATRWLDDD